MVMETSKGVMRKTNNQLQNAPAWSAPLGYTERQQQLPATVNDFYCLYVTVRTPSLGHVHGGGQEVDGRMREKSPS